MPTSPPAPKARPLPPQVLQGAAAMFGLLATTARLQIMWLLAAGERDVGTLGAEVGQSVAAVSQHLTKLKLAGLVGARREGRRQVYLVDDPHVVEIVQLVAGHHLDQQRRPRRRAKGA